MYIITNTYEGGEYTPSKTQTLKEAKDWVKECTANNIRYYKYDLLYGMSDEEVIKWANDNLPGFIFTGVHSCIYYGETYNIMHVYDLDKI